MIFPLLETAIHQTLQHDPASASKLRALEGQRIGITLENFSQTIYLDITTEGVEFSQSTDKTDSNLELIVSAQTIIKLLQYRFDQNRLEPGELRISGDPILAQKFLQIVADLKINSQAILAEQFGQEYAYCLTQAGKSGKYALDYAKQQSERSLKEALNRPDSPTANKQEVERYLDAVDDIRARTESLEIRLQRLQSQLKYAT